MKTILIIAIALCVSFRPYTKPTEEEKAKRYIKANTTQFSPAYQKRIVYCVIKYSRQYKLPPYLLARQIDVESDFKRRAFSTKSCRGLMQISDYHWRHVLYRLDNGKLGKHLNKKLFVDHRRYYYRIGYSIQAGCIIMSQLIKKYGSYELALLRYGYTTRAFKKYRNDPMSAEYVRSILGD